MIRKRPSARAAATLLVLTALAAPAFQARDAAAHGSPITFDFADPKGVNTVNFYLDSVLEPFSGMATGISGNVIYNPHHADHIRGRVTIETASLRLGNGTMTEHLHGERWLDAERYPYIEFILTGARDVEMPEPNVIEFTAVGNFTCRDVTKEITAPVWLTYLPGRMGERVSDTEGDLVVMRTEFTINRLDYGINPDSGIAKVSDEIDVRLAIVGCAPKAVSASSP